MSITPDEQVCQQWDYLFNLLATNTNVGTVANKPVPGAGTNPSGLLQTVMSIGQSSWPDFSTLPWVGVQLEEWDPPIWAATRRYKVQSKFTFHCVVNVIGAGEALLRLDDAMKELRVILVDGIGGGLTHILRASANYKLGGLADKTWIGKSVLSWDKSPTGKGTEYIAFAVMEYFASSFVQP